MPTGYCNVPGCYSFENSWDKNNKPVYNVPNVSKKGYGVDGLRKELTRSASRTLRRRVLWLMACRLASNVDKLQRLFVCTTHFVSGKPSSSKDERNVDWVPTLHLPDVSTARVPTENPINRPGSPKTGVDAETEQMNEEVDSLYHSEDDIDISETVFQSAQEKQNFFKINQLEDKCKFLQDRCDDLEEKCRSLQEELEKLRSIIKAATINEDFFAANDEKTRYLTGFPSQILLMAMFEECEPFMIDSKLSTLTKFQKFVATLMRLRLDFDFTLIGHFFHVPRRTASRAFYEVLPIMNTRFDSLIFWPSHEKQFETMPLQFKESYFGNKVSVIVDCFEVAMERPSNPLAASQVYSNYKHGNRVKFEIGISPTGLIIFISKGHGGRSSDKCITENSDFLNHLRPGDVVLADRGFLVHDAVRLVRAEIHMPAFKGRGNQQMDPPDVEESRRVSHLRIHVERVIGYLRRHFKILELCP